MINVLIADDHSIFRTGLKEIFSCNKDVRYIGEAESGEELLEIYPEVNPDVIIMDANMPRMDGFSVSRILTSKFKNSRVLLMSFKTNKMDFYKAYKNGAMGIIKKDRNPDEFINAIKAVAGSEYYFEERIDDQFLNSIVERYSCYNSEQKEFPGLKFQLSNREIEILKLISRGYTSKRIATLLNVTIKTIEYHRKNIREKLNISSTTELISYFLENSGLGN